MHKIKAPYDPKINLNDIEREWIERSLQYHISVSASAKSLGISRATLYRKMKTYEIKEKGLTNE